MKKLNTLIIALTTLIFASCSLISNPVEKDNNTDNALFTLSFNSGNARTLSEDRNITEADLTDIDVSFVNEATNKKIFPISGKEKLTWYIQEGTYTVTVTAFAKGKKLIGSTKGIKVTKAEGGSATIIMDYAHEGSGKVTFNVTVKGEYELNAGNYYENIVYEDDDEEKPLYCALENSMNCVMLLKSVSTNATYKLNVNEKWSNHYYGSYFKEREIHANTLEPIPSGYYLLSLYDRGDDNKGNCYVRKIALEDNLIEVVGNTNLNITTDFNNYYNTTEIEPYISVDVVYENEDFSKTYICNPGDKIDLSNIVDSQHSLKGAQYDDWTWYPETNLPDIYDNYIIAYSSGRFLINKLLEKQHIVENPIMLDVPLYHLAGGNSTVVIDNQSINGCDFLVKNGKTAVLQYDSTKTHRDTICIKDAANVSFMIGSINANIIDFDFSYDEETGAYKFFLLNDDKQVYVASVESLYSKTIILSDDDKKGEDAIAIAEHGDSLYFMDSDKYIYCSVKNPNSPIATIAASLSYTTVVDMKIIDNILYVLTSNNTDLGRIGGIYALDLDKIEGTEADPVYNDSVLGMYDGVTVPEIKVSNFFLGPCKILGLYDGNVYIADEGIYTTTDNQIQWRTRVMSFEHNTSIEEGNAVSYRDLTEKYLLSNSTTDTQWHFESTWNDSEFVNLN